MMFPGLHPAAMMSVPGGGGMALPAGVTVGQQGAAPQSAAGPGFAPQVQQQGVGGPSQSNGWGRHPGGNSSNSGMFNGAGQRPPHPPHHAAAAAAPLNPFAAAAAAAAATQVRTSST